MSMPPLSPLRSPTIILVEDDGEMRKLLRAFLERDGFRAVEYESATLARADIERQTFDAVILDKEMPGLDGLDFLAFVHGRFPAVPVILVTAFGGCTVEAAAFARGASRYIEKPFRIGDVVSALRSVIGDAARA
jgi:DNA-binding NtrC family response regulator